MGKSVRDKAIESFNAGMNCAQAVVSSFSEELNFDKELAVSISCGFGGGMGRMGGTCGAVTGSYMVMGIVNCKKFKDNLERKEASYRMVQDFDSKFRLIHGTTDCRTLLNCDIKTEVGHSFAVENKLFEKVCGKCIDDSIRIIKEIAKIG